MKSDSVALSDVLDSIFDEKLLEKHSISKESFAIENLLLLIDKRDALEEDIYLASIDNDVCYFYSKICENPIFASYADSIRLLLLGTMNKQKIASLKSILLEMRTILGDKTNNNIIIKNCYG